MTEEGPNIIIQGLFNALCYPLTLTSLFVGTLACSMLFVLFDAVCGRAQAAGCMAGWLSTYITTTVSAHAQPARRARTCAQVSLNGSRQLVRL